MRLLCPACPAREAELLEIPSAEEVAVPVAAPRLPNIDTVIQRYRDTEIQRYRDTEVQRYRDIEI